ncbi:MAG: hypothetical protein P8Y54_14080 [Xanthomonadales bacterium]
MSHTRLTLLVEDLAALAAATPGASAPALARCLARGRPLTRPVANADDLRLDLFGIRETAPVAALTAAADGLATHGDARYWLRVDPVTLTADLTRVFMTARGLTDIEAADRDPLQACVESVLDDAGYRLLQGRPGRWLLALDADPGVRFTRLEDALGVDLAEVLPDAADAREWRRLLTDVQVALHNAEVNVRRRARGVREVNGVWIWGGGRLPKTRIPAAFECVVSEHPVSQGLAALAESRARPGAEQDAAAAIAEGGRVLLDWAVGRSGALEELGRLERFFAGLLPDVRRGRLAVTLLDGGGRGWQLDRAALRRFWRRARPLDAAVSGAREART